jgi:hypothetical protein
MFINVLANPQKFAKYCLLFSIYVLSLLTFLKFSNSLVRDYSDKDTGLAKVTIDFNAYTTGALILKTDPHGLYNIGTQKYVQEKYLGTNLGGLLPFRNTPMVALMYVPYTNVAVSSAYFTNSLVQTALTILYVVLLVLLIGYKKILIPLAFIFLPTIYQPLYGQIAVLIALVLLAIYYLVKSDKLFWAGILSALLLLKIQYIIFIPYLFLIINRKKSYLVGLVISLFSLITIDSLIYKGFYLADYIPFLFRSEKIGMGTNLTATFSITSFLRSVHFSDALLYSTVLGIYIISLVIVGRIKSKVSFESLFAGIVLLTISINLHALLVDLIILLIPIFILGNLKNRRLGFLIPILFLIPFASTCNLQGLAGVSILVIALYILYSSHKPSSNKNNHIPFIQKSEGHS